MAGGWLIGVLVEPVGAGAPVRHFYAIGLDDQAQAEWAAVDLALQVGAVAPSPVGGLEPVQAIRRIPPQRMTALGLAPGERRPLGWKPPRSWLS